MEGHIPPSVYSTDGVPFDYPDGFTSKNCLVLNKMWGDGPDGSTWLEGDMFAITLYQAGIDVRLDSDWDEEQYVRFVLFRYV